MHANSGLSLKTQELTASFLAIRLVCSTIMEADIHTLLDFSTLISTAWVIYMIRFKLKSTYIKELDNFRLYFVVKIFCCCCLLLIEAPNSFSCLPLTERLYVRLCYVNVCTWESYSECWFINNQIPQITMHHNIFERT